ncbi:MAG TPA: hypothetical protein VFQ81_00250 [Candidatus Limnocylindria bacterium]|nr:hypothetical protein [Candidatus Limnocylindria bacterium]
MQRIGLAALTVLVAGALTLVGLQLLNGPPAPGAGSGASPNAAVTSLMSMPTASPPSAPPPTPAPMSPEPTTTVHASGILLIDVDEPVQGGPVTNEDRAMAFSGLIDLAMAHPSDLGYPFEDPETHDLIISAASDAGRALAEETGPTLGFPFRIREVAYSYAELQQMSYDISLLGQEGVPDADLMFQLVPDWRDNRIMVVIREMSEPLLATLAERFPPDALAVQVDPRGGAMTGY